MDQSCCGRWQLAVCKALKYVQLSVFFHFQVHLIHADSEDLICFERGLFLKRHDQEIALSRSKLNLLNRHGLNALESERKHLAERILRLCRQQAAIDHSRIDPFDFYDHNQFKKDFEDYQQDVPQRGIERDKYAEF